MEVTVPPPPLANSSRKYISYFYHKSKHNLVKKIALIGSLGQWFSSLYWREKEADSGSLNTSVSMGRDWTDEELVALDAAESEASMSSNAQ